MAVSEPKRHHYVPRFYLEYFTSETAKGTHILYVYDKDGGEARIQTPVNTAVEQGFYSFETPSGKDHETEAALSRVESDATPVLTRLTQPDGNLKDSDIQPLSVFLALMHVRVPRSVKAVSEVITVGVRQLIKRGAEDRERIRRFIASRDKDFGLTEDELIELLVKFDDHFFVTPNPKSALLQSLSLFPKIAEILFHMNWHLCRAPHGRYFVTSDSPLCVFYEPMPGYAGFGGGLLMRNAEVTFPISPRVLLLLDWKRNQRAASVSATFVREMNRRMAWCCERYLISNIHSKATEAIVREASVTRSLPKMEPGRLRQYMEEKLRKAPS